MDKKDLKYWRECLKQALTDELGFTPESLEFYNDRIDEVERMANKMMGVYSDNHKK